MQENRNPRLMKEQWLDRYLYTKIHRIFLCSFPVELYEWIAKLEDDRGRWRLDGSIVWTTEVVWKLETSEDKIARDFNHWPDCIIGWFVIEIVVDTLVNYSEAKHFFFKGPRGNYLKSLNTWIKMLLCEKRVMQLP